MKNWVVFLLFFFLIALTIPIPFLNNKSIHISIDDFHTALKDLCDSNYNSIFEQPTFHFLQNIHKHTGAKFTLFTYAEATDYKVSCIPQKHIIELSNNSDWLLIGFHSATPDSRNENDSLFKLGFQFVQNRFGDKTKTLRLHYFHATPDEIGFLKKNEISTLLSADDDRISYSLSPKLNDSLKKNDFLLYNGIQFKRTDFRIEKTFFPILDIWKHLNDDEIIFFTHEWSLDSWNSIKFKSTIYYLSFYGSYFTID